MEKKLITNAADKAEATLFFGKKYENEILKLTKNVPCILIGHYSEDIEFGSGYDFTVVTLNEFKKECKCKTDKDILINKKENNCHPYGDNISYNECPLCKEKYNFKVN